MSILRRANDVKWPMDTGFTTIPNQLNSDHRSEGTERCRISLRELRNHRQHAHGCPGEHERFDRLVLLPTASFAQHFGAILHKCLHLPIAYGRLCPTALGSVPPVRPLSNSRTHSRALRNPNGSSKMWLSANLVLLVTEQGVAQWWKSYPARPGTENGFAGEHVHLIG